MGAPRRDLTQAFQHGKTCSDADATYKVKVIEIGRLVTPSGKLFACDPFTIRHIQPFERSVKRGSYAVFASVAQIKYRKLSGRDQARVGAAMIRFSAGTPASWVLATKRGQKLSKLVTDEIFGYGVDAGTGCFCDVAAARALEHLNEVEFANGNWEGYLLPKIQHELSSPTWGASWITDPATGANLVAFPSGWGDGFYASYWGLARTGKPLCLVTDFGVYPDGRGAA